MVTVDRFQGLSLADLDIDVGQGSFKFGQFQTEFDAANLVAVLSAESQDMDIISIGLKSDKLSFSGGGALTELGAMTDGNINSSPVFDLVFENVLVDRTPTLLAPLKLPTLKMSGRLDLDGRELNFDRFQANFGHYDYDPLRDVPMEL